MLRDTGFNLTILDWLWRVCWVIHRAVHGGITVTSANVQYRWNIACCGEHLSSRCVYGLCAAENTPCHA